MKPVYIICLGRLCGNDFGLPSICVWQVSSPAYFDRTVYFFALCGRLSDETQCVGCGVLGRGGAMCAKRMNFPGRNEKFLRDKKIRS